MKKFLMALALSGAALSAQADGFDFFGGNDGEWKMGPYGPYYEESDWPEWTPMYWMEEFMDSFDDDEQGYNNFGGGMPFAPMPYGMPPYGGYGAAPMMPMPQGNVAMPAFPQFPMAMPPVAPVAPAAQAPQAPASAPTAAPAAK